ncbi:MAG: hypothetical protein V4656_10490 [Pseudomonadota bacterium]
MPPPQPSAPQSFVSWLGAICALSFCAGVTPSNAQSYSEGMSELSAQQFDASVQDRISASTHDGPTYYLSRDYTLTPEQEQYLEQQRQDDEKLNALRKDPVLIRYVNGSWDHY